MEEAQHMLEGITGLDPVIYAQFYKLCTEYAKAME